MRAKMPSLFLACALLLWIPLEAAAQATRRIPEGGQRERATIAEDRSIFLEIPSRRTSEAEIRRQYLHPDLAEDHPLDLTQSGKWVALPLDALSPEWTYRSIMALFPDDRVEDGDWVHVVTYTGIPGGGETLYRIAVWLTGTGRQVEAIKAHNQRTDNALEAGDEIRVPLSLVRPGLREAAQKRFPEAGGQTYPIAGGDERLTFKTSPQLGEYAEYRIRPGETIYSDVVVRYCGLLDAQEVIALAGKIAKDSFITDVTDIKVNYPVRIRSEYIQPEFLYPDHPRFQQLRAHEATIANVPSAAFATDDLEGVYIIIDPGHGGHDPGAQYDGVWEHDYCYDIAVRLKNYLDRNTRATTALLVVDKETGERPINARTLTRNRREVVPTTPEYAPTDSRKSLNLRCFLANSLIHEWRAKGASPSQIVLLSIHADALHQSVRGSMAYYPDTRYTSASFGKRDSFYHQFKEVSRHQGSWSFPMTERQRAEAASRRLGQNLLADLKDSGFPVHPHTPLRGSIQRSAQSSRFVPAILRFTSAGVKVLLETVNLNNSKDRKLMVDYEWRQRYAESVGRTLVAHYK